MSRRTPTGEKRWNARRNRWEGWTGRRWAPAMYSANLAALRSETPLAAGPTLSVEAKEKWLDRVVEQETLAGANVASRRPGVVVLSVTHRSGAPWYLLPLFLVAGALALMARGATGGQKDERWMAVIDDQGHVWRHDTDVQRYL